MKLRVKATAVIESDQDLVLIGTQGTVLGYTGNDNNGPGAQNAELVDVVWDHYITAERHTMDGAETGVCSNLVIASPPKSLEVTS